MTVIHCMSSTVLSLYVNNTSKLHIICTDVLVCVVVMYLCDNVCVVYLYVLCWFISLSCRLLWLCICVYCSDVCCGPCGDVLVVLLCDEEYECIVVLYRCVLCWCVSVCCVDVLVCVELMYWCCCGNDIVLVSVV